MKYKTYSFRLNEETMKLLREIKMREGKSWNRFIYNLLEKYDKSNNG